MSIIFFLIFVPSTLIHSLAFAQASLLFLLFFLLLIIIGLLYLILIALSVLFSLIFERHLILSPINFFLTLFSPLVPLPISFFGCVISMGNHMDLSAITPE